MKPTRLHSPAFDKLFIILLTACTGFFAPKVQAQQGKYRITLSARQIPVKEVIYNIRQQTGLQVFFSNELINAEERVDVDFRSVSLDNVLKKLFGAKGFYWVYREEAIVLIPKNKDQSLPGQGADSLPAQSISGTVTNDAGRPVVGATVFLKGQDRGAVTNEGGRFSFTGVRPGQRLVISAMGYKIKELPAKDKTISVQLETSTTDLDETVVIAYGTASRRMLTGSVGKVSARDIANQPVSNPLQALQGRVAGLHIIPINGLPGSDFKIELRGQNSIASGNNPLYIVDGVPFTSTPLTWDLDGADDAIKPTGRRRGFGANLSSNPLNTINPADIESIEILKDADATAIYGSRGANGVILITTKKGKVGTLKADVNVYTGWGRVGHMIPYLNTQQYLTMRREALMNDGANVHAEDYDLTVWDTTRYTNWQKAMIGGTAHITDAQAAVSGGSANAQYRISGGYRSEGTAYPGDFSYQKASGRMQFSLSTPDQRFTANLFASYVADKNYLPKADASVYSTLPPNAPAMYKADGSLNWEKGVFDNPYGFLQRVYKANTDNLTAGALLSYQVLPGLQLKASLGYTRMHMDEVQPNPKISFNPAGAYLSGFSYFADNNIKTWILEPQANYQREWGKGKLDVLVGVTFQQDLRDQKAFYGGDYTSDALLEDMAAAANITPQQGSINTVYRYNALFGRINYAWDEKYILNFTGRRDGSSRFGPGSQFANFGSIGAAWIFTKEKWLSKTRSLLSFGKLRASYGVTGNDQIADYGYLDTYSPGPYYQNIRGLFNDRLYNPYYGWEKNTKLETGLELGFIQDRILLRAAYYSNRSSNQLVKYSLSGVTGFTSIRANIPAVVANTGVELELSAVNFRRRYFTWTTGFNLTIPRNKLLAFPGLENSTYNRYYTIGQPLNQFKGFHYLGVNPQTGVYIIEDMDKDEKLTYNDYKYTKTLGATLYGGWQNSLQYKGWQLDVLFQFVRQNGYNYLYVADFIPGPGAAVNQPATVLYRWQKPGDRTNIQRFTQDISSAAGAAFLNISGTDQSITDASFIRLKSLSLAYQLPQKWIQKLRLESTRLYLQGQNLLTITSYPGRDPENAALLDANGYPPLSVWTAGLQIGF